MAIERIKGPYLTRPGEFVYGYLDHNDKAVPVRKDQKFIKVYYASKEVKFVLTSSRQKILKVKNTEMLHVYKKSGTPRQRDEYPIRSYPTSVSLATKKFITRIFAQNKISGNKEVFEVVKETNATSFKFVKFQWQVSGNLDQAILFNRQQLREAVEVIPELLEMLPLDQLHITKFQSAISQRPEYYTPPPPDGETAEYTSYQSNLENPGLPDIEVKDIKKSATTVKDSTSTTYTNRDATTSETTLNSRGTSRTTSADTRQSTSATQEIPDIPTLSN